MKYEVWGIGYDAEGIYTEYMEKYGEFDTPAEALTFAHNIDAEWLTANGGLYMEAMVDICVEGSYEEGQLPADNSLYIHRIEIYHRMQNSGVQSQATAV